MWTSSSMNIGEALITSAMGFSIVFMVLIFLALVILVTAKIMGTAEGKKKAAQPAAAPVAAAPEKDDSEIVAIVTSVICEELNADPSEIQITGIREA